MNCLMPVHHYGPWTSANKVAKNPPARNMPSDPFSGKCWVFNHNLLKYLSDFTNIRQFATSQGEKWNKSLNQNF